MEYKIDKGIPAPRKQVVPLNKMKVNESFAFPETERNNIASRASVLKKTKGKWFTIQKVDPETCRIWRIK